MKQQKVKEEIENMLEEKDKVEGVTFTQPGVSPSEVHQNDIDPGDHIRVNFGGSGTLTDVRVFSVIITDQYGTFYNCLVDPDEMDGHVHFLVHEDWVEEE